MKLVVVVVRAVLCAAGGQRRLGTLLALATAQAEDMAAFLGRRRRHAWRFGRLDVQKKKKKKRRER